MIKEFLWRIIEAIRLHRKYQQAKRIERLQREGKL